MRLRFFALAALSTLCLPSATRGCTCSQDEAACDQTVIALCELEEQCRGGSSLDTCLSVRDDFTCTVDVDASEACVDAVNAILAGDCAGIDDELPCPNLDQANLYDGCSDTVICAAGRECLEIVEGERLCSVDCGNDTTCPEGGGCFLAGGFCLPTCSATAFCDGVSACVNERCETCESLCTDFGSFDGCDCTIGLPCGADSQCDSGFCTDEGFCA